MRVGVIGAGNVGGTLGRRWAEEGHEVRFGVRDADDRKVAELLARSPGATAVSVREAAEQSEVVVLATPWPAAEEAVRSAGNLTGKVLIDVTNPIKADFSGLEVGFSESGGELVQAWADRARVVKIFNTIGYNMMENPSFNGRPATMFYRGDDPDSKRTAASLEADLGFDPVDAGPLAQARLLEPLAWLWISMAVKLGCGRDMALHLMRR